MGLGNFVKGKNFSGDTSFKSPLSIKVIVPPIFGNIKTEFLLWIPYITAIPFVESLSKSATVNCLGTSPLE